MRPDMYSSFMNTSSLAAAAAAAVQNRSPWHSPVPYLFGGLAAMLGLIAFALLILACSYWKLSGYFESNGEAASAAAGNDQIQQHEGGAGGRRTTDDVMMMMKPLESLKICGDYEEKIVVIMAGEQKPTFLAKPIRSSSSSSSSFKTAEAADDDQVTKELGFDQMGDDQKKKDYNLEEEHEHGNHYHDHAVADLDQFVGGTGTAGEYYSADRHEEEQRQ